MKQFCFLFQRTGIRMYGFDVMQMTTVCNEYNFFFCKQNISLTSTKIFLWKMNDNYFLKTLVGNKKSSIFATLLEKGTTTKSGV